LQTLIEVGPEKYKCGVEYAFTAWTLTDAGRSYDPIEFGGGGSNSFTAWC
jgi:hypothetical protein